MKDNKELHLLENYLSDNQAITYNYVDKQYESKNFKILKESLDNRFRFLYMKRNRKYKMNENDYEFAGFLDVIDKKIYNPLYELRSALKESTMYELDDLDNLRIQIKRDVANELCDYTLSNSNSLKKLCKKEFWKQDDYHFNYYKKEANELFVSNKDLKQVKLEPKKLLRYCHFIDNQAVSYTGYLDNPKVTAKEIMNHLVKDDEMKNKLSWELLEMDYKNRYLDSLYKYPIKNNYLYINREILDSIKDTDAVNLNITISYNNKELTFKFPKERLKMSLKNANKNDCSYGKSYEEVEKFLKENKQDENSFSKTDFDFENITKISYGKKILYEANIDKNIEKEIDEIER